MSSNINVKPLKVTKEKFFMYWLKFLKPYHKLANKEMEIMAVLLLKRNELLKKINDEVLVDIVLFERKSREEIRIKMGYKNHGVLNNMLTRLRKKDVLVGNKIDKGLIPNLTDSHNNFKLIFEFTINEA